MSDVGRKDFSTKAKESITPDSSKSTYEKVKETATDTTDRVAREAPDESKSGQQSAFDHVERSKDHGAHGSTGETVVDKTKNALGLGK
ncbi:MAG: hypothetical protein M1824_004546 [Vezdaea acicularis]|nr:MAG: hypothetical protein M1824_004546 [Vezdaea acicularis]